MKRFFFLLLACAVAALPVVAQEPAGHPLLLEPAQVWTAGEPLHSGWVVLIEGNKIKAVGLQASVAVPPDAERIALPGMTVLPGLMDLHSHIFLHPYNEKLWDQQVLTEPPQYRTVLATKHADATLMAGFTTLRDLGTEGAGFGDVDVKRAIHEGIIPGPRLWVATRAIVATASPRSCASRSAFRVLPPARATASLSMSAVPAGSPSTPASRTIVSTPDCCRRSRTNAYSRPFVSSVPMRSTVGIVASSLVPAVSCGAGWSSAPRCLSIPLVPGLVKGGQGVWDSSCSTAAGVSPALCEPRVVVATAPAAPRWHHSTRQPAVGFESAGATISN